MADKINMNEWMKLSRKYLGKHAENFLIDLILVSINLKPCLLYDYICLDAKKIVELLENVSETLGSRCKFSVIMLGQDLVIADITRLVVVLKHRLKNKAFTLIDVSGNLEKPRIVGENDEKSLLVDFNDFITQLELHADNSTVHYHSIEVKDQWNLSSIFGFALGYPVIYWFDPKIEYNCLSLEPLRLYKTILSLPSLGNIKYLSFDFTKFSNKDRTFYAFTCPEIIQKNYTQKYIDNWTEDILRISTQLEIQVGVEESSVVLEEVML